MSSSLVSRIKTASIIADDIDGDRTTYSIFASAMSEAGELGQELTIHHGDSYKTASEDGVIGEAIDTIITLLDLIHVHNPEFTEEELNEYASKKATKWLKKIHLCAVIKF